MTVNDTAPRAGNPVDDDGHEMVCRDCFWYTGSVLSGLCVGAPPSVYVAGLKTDLAGVAAPILGSAWPIVDGHRYCGTFRYDAGKVPEPLALSLVDPDGSGDTDAVAA